MNRKYSAAVVSALALSAAALGATQASAREAPEPGSTTTPDCHWAYHPACKEVPVPEPNVPEYNYPEYKLDVPTGPTGPAGSPQALGDDIGVEVLQTGASALGGAGLALGGLWLYRRRHAPVV
jgi:hypothetical protein